MPQIIEDNTGKTLEVLTNFEETKMLLKFIAERTQRKDKEIADNTNLS